MIIKTVEGATLTLRQAKVLLSSGIFHELVVVACYIAGNWIFQIEILQRLLSAEGFNVTLVDKGIKISV